jgi:hypothetical protein
MARSPAGGRGPCHHCFKVPDTCDAPPPLNNILGGDNDYGARQGECKFSNRNKKQGAGCGTAVRDLLGLSCRMPGTVRGRQVVLPRQGGHPSAAVRQGDRRGDEGVSRGLRSFEHSGDMRRRVRRRSRSGQGDLPGGVYEGRAGPHAQGQA